MELGYESYPDGCDLYAACLTCPLPVCRYDLEPLRGRALAQAVRLGASPDGAMAVAHAQPTPASASAPASVAPAPVPAPAPAPVAPAPTSAPVYRAAWEGTPPGMRARCRFCRGKLIAGGVAHADGVYVCLNCGREDPYTRPAGARPALHGASRVTPSVL